MCCGVLASTRCGPGSPPRRASSRGQNGCFGRREPRSRRAETLPKLPCARSSLGQEAIPSAPFEREALSTIVAVRQSDPPAYQRTISQLKQAGVRLRDLERELRRASFRVVEGGPATAATDPAVQAGPYFVTRDGMIAWRKETRDGSVPVPLCNFTAQIVAEEVIDDGAERRTILGIEGTMPDGRRLPCARVPAERFNSHELGD